MKFIFSCLPLSVPEPSLRAARSLSVCLARKGVQTANLVTERAVRLSIAMRQHGWFNTIINAIIITHVPETLIKLQLIKAEAFRQVCSGFK